MYFISDGGSKRPTRRPPGGQGQGRPGVRGHTPPAQRPRGEVTNKQKANYEPVPQSAMLAPPKPAPQPKGPEHSQGQEHGNKETTKKSGCTSEEHTEVSDKEAEGKLDKNKEEKEVKEMDEKQALQ